MALVDIDTSGTVVRPDHAKFDMVLVVNPPSPPGYVANRESHGGYGQIYPLGAPIPISLDVPYLVAYLSSKHVPLTVLEAQGLELTCGKLVEEISKLTNQHARYSTLVVVRVALCCLDWDLSVCRALKDAAPDSMLAVYGSVIPEIQKRVEKESCIDFIVQGEPDETLYELACGGNREGILGLHFRCGEFWIHNPPRPMNKDLDRLPFPKWELLPYHRYTIPKSSATQPIPYLPMLTSRGCPFGCHYCPYPINQGLAFRFRSPQNVVDEIEHLVNDLGIQYVIFRDPMFSLRQDRVIAICREIQRRNLHIRWKCETRIDCLDETTLRAMAAAGCEGINFGIESAKIEIQSNVGRKPISQEKIRETVALCRKIGIKTFCFFIVGLPGDTVETIMETIGFAIRLQPTWVQFNAASPLIGTKLRTWAVSNGFAPDDAYSYRTSHEAMMGNENLTKERVASMHKFAVFFERYLMNRGGILKDENRRGPLYSFAFTLTNWSASIAMRVIFAIGRLWFGRSGNFATPPAREGAV